ncbi:MAG: InlB B-repeat-containing protein, partial [Fibromonadales bacterium]|nr:InlB B-repeat-containing protein [Fibromonadales bacterium]
GLEPGTYRLIVDVGNDVIGRPRFEVSFEVRDIITVTFNSNGGSPVDPIENVEYGSTIPKPTSDPTKDFHDFLGWFDGDADEPFDFEKDLVWDNITLTARWQPCTENNPCIITTADELMLLAKRVNEGNTEFNNLDVYYKLGSDIDLEAISNWTPIGNFYYNDADMQERPFVANFDGAGYKIRNLKINAVSTLTENALVYDETTSGLFGVINGRVENLGLENVNIVLHNSQVGGIAGSLWGGGSIKNSYVAGGIISTGSSYIDYAHEYNYGGVAGRVNGSIDGCYSTAEVSILRDADGTVSYTGGIAGIVYYDAIHGGDGGIRNSMALNQKVIGSSAPDGSGAARVANSSSGILMNNRAFAGMLNGAGKMEWHNIGANQMDGQSRTNDELKTAEHFLAIYANDPWKYEAGKLPGLNNEPVEMPEHLKTMPTSIERVIVTPANAQVQRSKTLQLSAVVEGTGTPSQNVVWSISNRIGCESEASSISDGGLLSVQIHEAVDCVLTIRATSDGEDGIFDEATIIVTAEPVPPTIVGEPSLTLRLGYEAASTDAFTIIAGSATNPVVEKISGDAKITWNNEAKALNIAAGLASGVYEVELEVSCENTGLSSKFNFRVIVPAVENVTVSPTVATVQRDMQELFTAIVTGTNNSQDVTWGVEGNTSAGTTILEGSLYVASNEEADELTVIATSVDDPSKSGTATVAVTDAPVPPAISGIDSETLIEGYDAISIPYTIGGTKPVVVTVTVDGSDNPLVTWNNSTDRLQIAAGLAIGEYTIVLTASNITKEDDVFTLNLNVAAPPTIASVVVAPNAVDVQRGFAHQFSAEAMGSGNPPQNVLWTVEGGSAAGTAINSSGLLSIAANETATTLTVKATSEYDNSKSGTATINVTSPAIISGETDKSIGVGYTAFSVPFTATGNPAPTITKTSGDSRIVWNEAAGELEIPAGLSVNDYIVVLQASNGVGAPHSISFTLRVTPVPTVTDVVVAPNAPSVIKGGTQQFFADVEGEYSPSTDVTWSIESSVLTGTEISSSGLLTISADETATTIVIRATSGFDPDKYGEATVTVTDDAVPAHITGPTSKELIAGYEATFVEYVVEGTDVNVTIDVAAGLEHFITWNSINNRLEIATGLTGGEYEVELIATGSGEPSYLTFILTVSNLPIVTQVVISPSTDVSVKIGEAQSFDAVVQGANNPSQAVIWEIASDVAEGTTLIGGVLTVAENETAESITIKATSVQDPSKSNTVTVMVTVIIPVLPTITTASLPEGKQGEAYNATITATGDAPIAWSIVGGVLPAGLTFNSGTISGTPTAVAGTYYITVKAENEAGDDTKAFSIEISGTTTIISALPNAGMLNARIQNGTLHLNGLSAGKTWSVYSVNGTLVHQSIASGTEASVKLNVASGVYFVKSNGQVLKLVNR